MNFITSLSNSKIKQIVKLANSRARRYEDGLAVIYGKHLVLEALKYDVLDCVFINYSKYDDYLDIVKDIAADNVYAISHEILAKINLSDSLTDIIGLIQIKLSAMSDDIYHDDCVILDNIQDPGNLGTIMRSCTACGIKNVLLSKSCVDPYNLKVLRASQGIQFGLNILNNIDIAKFASEYKYDVIATMPNATESIYQYNLTKPCAWLFGNEGAGISKDILENITCRLSIPMQNNSESLNVAMASTICLFEMFRQRSNYKVV